MIDPILEWLTRNSVAIQAITHVVSILGIPVFIALFIRRTRAEDLARQEKIYDDVDEAFVAFNRMILDYPHLNVTWFENATGALSDNDRTQQYVIFDLLTNMFERAFLTYDGASSEQRHLQWQGWVEYIDQYCAKPAYRAWWQDARHKQGEVYSLTYDKSFERFMLDRLGHAEAAAKTKAAIATPPPLPSAAQ